MYNGGRRRTRCRTGPPCSSEWCASSCRSYTGRSRTWTAPRAWRYSRRTGPPGTCSSGGSRPRASPADETFSIHHLFKMLKTARSYRNVNIFNSCVQNVKVDFLKTVRSYRNIFCKTCTLYVTYVNIYGAVSFLHVLSKFRYCHDTCIPITRYCSGFPNHISVN